MRSPSTRTRGLSLLAVLGASLVTGGCRKGAGPETPKLHVDMVASTPSAKGSPPASAEVSLGTQIGSWPTVLVGIDRVFRRQKPLDQAPWHSTGGDWTFLECRLRQSSGARFLIGVQSGRLGPKPITWGKALLAAWDRDSGSQVVDAFAKAFEQQTPRAKSPQPLEALRLGSAVLGIDVTRGREGGFGGAGGHWTPTKWFLQVDGYEAELYFNYNLDEGVAEFSEKDPDYRADLIAVLARVLRDGPRPERTPETDPSIQAEGPGFSNWRLLSSSGSAGRFSDDGSSVVFQEKTSGNGERLLRQSVESSGVPIEIFRTAGRISNAQPLDASADRFLLLESHPKDRGVWSSEDPAGLLLVGGGATQRLSGPWGNHPDLPETALSADRRYLAVTAWRDRTDGKKGRYRTLHICELSSGTVRGLAGENTSWSLERWVGSKDRPLALVASGSSFEKKPRTFRLWDPRTGTATPTAAAPEEKNPRKTAPDGLHSFRLLPGPRLAFEQEARPVREFAFHEDDARFAEEGCCDWVSARYVFFRGPRPAFIDSVTGKMSLPSPKGLDLGTLAFRADFRWALSHRENGLWIGEVVLPIPGPSVKVR